jgi:cytoskeletal protein RodZ
MAKRVIIIVVLLVLAVSAYYSYNRYDARRAGGSGEVFSNDPQSARVKVDSVSRVAGSSDKKASDSDEEKIVYPSSVTVQTTPAAEASPATSPATAISSDAQVTQTGEPAHESNPATDTISANPPNGMKFAGQGKYQVYRQGNITWRLNTETGQTCVLFATDEEWKKPRVYHSGCGSVR